MYCTTVVITEPNLNGEYGGDGYEYRVETMQPFTGENLSDVVFQALEIERIYSGRILIEITKEKDGEYVDSDDTEAEVDIILTQEKSPFIQWDKCPALPPIYKIDRSASTVKLLETGTFL